VRVQVGDIRLFFETYGAEWVLDGDKMRRRPVVLALHGGPGADATGLRHALAPLTGIAQLVVPTSPGTDAAIGAHPRHGTLPGGRLMSGNCARSPACRRRWC
jgi:hypothetical protein